jgi:hypothetical protein
LSVFRSLTVKQRITGIIEQFTLQKRFMGVHRRKAMLEIKAQKRNSSLTNRLERVYEYNLYSHNGVQVFKVFKPRRLEN